ncbi:hypothetical protein Pmani_030445 [Petrolisthes manimaculis]|uniref:CRAL-TRIO domain-containing protein n=1 Tax=Petrolisthes manimaculis TaxID=1843537 RepID=A0AAE1TVX5_9EUCA|nr:hypothetical protein Pmani_030445 [Petrolisthes manimaculis]
MFVPLMEKDPNGRRVVITRIGLEDPKETKVDDLMKVSMMLMDVFLEEYEDVSITGLTLMEDVKELSMVHVVSFTPVMMKKMMTLIQGRKVVLTRAGLNDPNDISLQELVAGVLMVVEVFFDEEEVASVTGVVMVEDVRQITMTHMVALTPVYAKKMSTLLQVTVGGARVFLPLPGTSPNGTRILLARPSLRNPAVTDMSDAAMAMILIADILLEEDESVAISGVELVLDSGNMSFQHAAQLNPNTIKKAAIVMQVILARPGLRDPATSDMNDLARVILTTIDLVLEEDELIGITGIEIVMDAGTLTMAHAVQMTPPLIKRISTIIQEGYPMRPKGLNYINTPAAFDTVFNIFKSFMKEKMKKRVHIHGSDMESLYKEVPRDILPVEYGGTNGTIEEIKNYWLQRVDARRDWLLEDEKYCVDESKRPGKAKTSAELFGIEGSFRKLNVD